MTNNPFDWKNYKPIISMKDVETARKSSFQQTKVINSRRAKGIEPSIVYSDKGMDADPKKFALNMPVMPKYDKNEARKQQRREKRNERT